MIEYHVVTSHIFQPKHMLWVLKRTVGMRRFFQASNYKLNPMSLKKKTLLQYAGLTTSVNMSNWLNLKHYR